MNKQCTRKGHGVIEEMMGKFKNLLDSNKSKNSTYQNLYDTAKAVLKEKLISMSENIKNAQGIQINSL
jgi:hypothetical protein